MGRHQCPHCRYARLCPGTERVDTEKSDIYSNDIREVRSQEMYSIVGSDILNAEINDGNYLGEKNNPVQHEPTGLTLSKGST